MADAGRRTAPKLAPEEHARLEGAHRELREAVATYQRAVEQLNEAPVAATGLEVAQQAVQTAEQRLWAVREDLLGWRRPSWAPSATATAEWFSDEDSVYDELAEVSAP